MVSGFFSARAFTALGLLLAGTAIASRGLDANVPMWAAVRVATASLAIGILPGALALLAFRAPTAVTELELLGFGFALSFVLVQLLTIAAIAGHWSAVTSMEVGAAITGVLAVIVLARGARISVAGDRLLLLLLVTMIGGALYVQGSPYSSSEDQIHVALVRRLAFWESPNLSELYFLTGVEKGFYPYPFPAVHYFVALVGRLSDLDVLFVYHKLRLLWGPVALSFIYLFAAATFGRRVAVIATLTAVAFVLNGTFANGFNFFWGQLAPFSHASDVSLGVLLPALITVTAYYMVSDDRRGRLFYGGTALALTGVLCIVHAREVVQQLVYLTAWLAATLASASDRRRVRWIGGLLAATLLLAVAYRQWHAAEMGFVSEVVGAERQELLGQLASASWFDLVIGRPSQATQGGQLMFFGGNAILLLLSPLLLLAFPGRLLVRFLGFSIFGYLLILRFPVFSIPYVLASYFEIMTSGMRNFIFFIHVSAGVILWIIAGAVCRMPRAIGVVAWIAAMAVLAAGWRFGFAWFYDRQDLFFLPLIVAWGAVLWWEWQRAPAAADPPAVPGQQAVWAVMTVAMAIWTFVPGDVMASNTAASGSALTAPYAQSALTPKVMFDQLGGCTDSAGSLLPFQPAGDSPVTTGPLRHCPPSPAFRQFAATHIPVNAVVAASKLNPYPLSVYLPVRIVTWPSLELTYHNETAALATYYQLWDRSLRTHRAQPFFNSTESPAERREFLTRLGIAYVVLDPGTYRVLKPILSDLPDLLVPRYDDGEWAVFEVKGSA